MTKSNRVRVTVVRDPTPESPLVTPRMRTLAMVGESLTSAPTVLADEEIQADRMSSDPTVVFTEVGGGISLQLRYPNDLSPLSELIMSAMYNTWTNTPERDNDGVADSVITAMTGTTDVVTCTTGAAFVAGHLAKFSGFTTAANNGVFKCTTGSATVPVFLGAGFVTEAAPAAAARIKVVGFQGAASDIETDGDGLISTSLDFTTLGLAAGQWIKIGGTATGDKFATAACNGWARIAATPTANAILLDHLPTGWTTDDGDSKTIKVWFGDRTKNGTTRNAVAIERGYLGQGTPSYLVERGRTAGRMTLTYDSRRKIGINFDLMGQKAEAASTVTLDASPDAAITTPIMASNVNIGRIYEAGSRVTSPNFIRSLSIELNNNLMGVESLDEDHFVDIDEGDAAVSGRGDFYFGDLTLLNKFRAGTATSLAVRSEKSGQAIVVGLPRITYTGEGNPNAAGKNQQVMLPLTFQSSRDDTTQAHILIDRLSYWEA